jgi:type IV pilus assembly protein PilM
MFSQLFKKNNNRVNLIISEDSIRFVELRHKQSLSVHDYGEYSLPEGLISDGRIMESETLFTILEECVSEWGIKKREVQFIVPNTQIIVRQMTIPSDIENDEVFNYLFLEIGTSIHLPFENPLFDAVVVGEKDEKKEIILVAAPEEIILDYQQLLEDAKLKPVAADIGPLALYRFLHYEGITEENNHELILYFTPKELIVSIFHQHQPVFNRPIVLNQEPELLSESNTQGVNDAGLLRLEDTFKELEKIISFYQYSLNKNEVMIDKILLTGEHPFLNEIQSHLETRLAKQTSIVECKIKDSQTGETIPSAYTLAIGLGLKEVL